MFEIIDQDKKCPLHYVFNYLLESSLCQIAVYMGSCRQEENLVKQTEWYLQASYTSHNIPSEVLKWLGNMQTILFPKSQPNNCNTQTEIVPWVLILERFSQGTIVLAASNLIIQLTFSKDASVFIVHQNNLICICFLG